MAKRTVSASEVRTWASEQGLQNGSRGRLTPESIDAFNTAHKGKAVYVPGVVKPTFTAKGFKTTAKGGKVPVTKRVLHGEVRAAARAAGVTMPDKGRIPFAIQHQFVNGTLGQ